MLFWLRVLTIERYKNIRMTMTMTITMTMTMTMMMMTMMMMMMMMMIYNHPTVTSCLHASMPCGYSMRRGYEKSDVSLGSHRCLNIRKVAQAVQEFRINEMYQACIDGPSCVTRVAVTTQPPSTDLLLNQIIHIIISQKVPKS